MSAVPAPGSGNVSQRNVPGKSVGAQMMPSSSSSCHKNVIGILWGDWLRSTPAMMEVLRRVAWWNIRHSCWRMGMV
eukprot:12929197-Prorocentrum_lima.AAC.1